MNKGAMPPLYIPEVREAGIVEMPIKASNKEIYGYA